MAEVVRLGTDVLQHVDDECIVAIRPLLRALLLYGGEDGHSRVCDVESET